MTRTIVALALAACAVAVPPKAALADILADLAAKGIADAMPVTRPGIADFPGVTLSELTRCLLKPPPGRADPEVTLAEDGPGRFRLVRASPEVTLTFLLVATPEVARFQGVELLGQRATDAREITGLLERALISCQAGQPRAPQPELAPIPPLPPTTPRR